MYFHGQEQSESSVRRERVQLLLELHEPLRCQMYVFQHDPTARLDGRVQRLVCLGETLRRTWKQESSDDMLRI